MGIQWVNKLSFITFKNIAIQQHYSGVSENGGGSQPVYGKLREHDDDKLDFKGTPFFDKTLSVRARVSLQDWTDSWPRVARLQLLYSHFLAQILCALPLSAVASGLHLLWSWIGGEVLKILTCSDSLVIWDPLGS